MANEPLPSAVIADTPPTPPQQGQIWIRQSDNASFLYTGSAWVGFPFVTGSFTVKPSTNIGITMTGTLSGGAGQVGFFATSLIGDSSGTNVMSAFRGSIAGSDTGTYSTNELSVFRADSITKGANQTVTAAYGFTVKGLTVTATTVASFDTVQPTGGSNLNAVLLIGNGGAITGVQTMLASGQIGQTLTGGLADGYTGAIDVTPSYAGAFTVSRHNYWNVPNPGLSASAVLTDACVFRFDANAGTHKAVDGSSTKTTPSGVDAWIKHNINGTIYYSPVYLSKTS